MPKHSMGVITIIVIAQIMVLDSTLSGQSQQTPLAECNGDQHGNGGKRNGDKEYNDEPPKKQRKVEGDQPWGAIGLGLDEDDRLKILNEKWLY